MKNSLLILDGDHWQRETLAAALAHEGWHTEDTGDAVCAMALLARYPFQLVLLDPSAPTTGGWATVKRLVRLHPELPVIVLAPSKTTAQSPPASVVSGNRAIRTPMNFAALHSTIQRAVSTPTETFILHCTERDQPEDIMLPAFVTAGSFAFNSATQLSP